MEYEKQHKLHIVTAVAVIRRDDGQILLLKRHNNEKVYPGYYTFPGGKVEGNDTISEALVREVKEECNLELKPGFILIKEKAIGRPDGQTSKSLSFLCSVDDPDTIQLNEDEFTDYAWVNLEELRALQHVGIEAEFIKAQQIYESQSDLSVFFTDTDKVDFREQS